MKKNVKSSAINTNYLVFDLETAGKNSYETDPIEISAMVVDFATLEPKEIIFNQLVLPCNWDKVEPEALRVNKITKEELLKNGRDQKIVFEEFIKYCRQYQRSDKKWDKLIPVTYNGTNFDHNIISRLCFKYGYLDGNQPCFFHPFHYFDVSEILRLWFHINDELPSYSLDNLREYFGLSQDGSHRAMKDVEDTYLIFRRFMEFHRKLTPHYIDKFKNCFSK